MLRASTVLQFPYHDPQHVFAGSIHSLAVLGTVHSHRNRWNPFEQANDMHRGDDGVSWIRWFDLHPNGGRHGDGVYNLRFIINHNPRRSLKLRHWLSLPFTSAADHSSSLPLHLHASLVESSLGLGGSNLTFRVHRTCAVCLSVDPISSQVSFRSSSREALSLIIGTNSWELNGFVWDEADMFQKFDERLPGRDFHSLSDCLWEISIPLSRDGGIDFRHDGVYQFLISRNGDEDQGLSAINSSGFSDRLLLVEGSGFGSSHGSSYHSAPTLRVERDGPHTLTLMQDQDAYYLWARGPDGTPLRFINQKASTIQLLGSVFSDHSFDPTHPQSEMDEGKTVGEFSRILDLVKGTYSINFAIGRELFLDTMGFGCWLKSEGRGLRGLAWHGKPNELNIGFRVHCSGCYRIQYDRGSDQFMIDPLSPECDLSGCLEAVSAIDSLSLVGSFDDPMESWSPASERNLMASLPGHCFEKLVSLHAGKSYTFKFVANRSDWLIVFADYELDGYGLSSEVPTKRLGSDCDLSDLRHHGHLTSHGNPPPLSFTPPVDGAYRFHVDLNTGAYAVEQLERTDWSTIPTRIVR